MWRNMITDLLSISVVLGVLLSLIQDVSAIECYYCRGVTHYDPNDCLNPTVEGSRTFIQNCAKNEVCEKKVTRIDHRQDVVERGCSSNCDSRTYIWTEDFSVYCCGEDNLCNSARTLSSKTWLSMGISILAVYVTGLIL